MSNQKTKFCRKCGKKLTVRIDGDHGYDINTGVKIFRIACPDYRLLTRQEILEEREKYPGPRIGVGDDDNGHTILRSDNLSN